MRVLNQNEIINVIWGATLLGGGGGGSMSNGIGLLNKYVEDHPGSPIEVDLIDVDEMEDGAFAAVTAGMGAPAALLGVDFSKYATNAFNTLKEMASGVGRKLSYSLAVELGGFNTFVPMLISMVNGIPLIDSDGAARAVPALDTLLLHINGCDTSPLAMADDKNNRLTIRLDDARDAHLAEELGRHICIAFNMKSGLSGWMVQKSDWAARNNIDRLPRGTVTLSEKVGNILRTSKNSGAAVFGDLQSAGIACKALCEGTVTDKTIETIGGFDYGKVTIQSGQDTWLYHFQNENLIIYKNDTPIITAPDIICAFISNTKEPLTNADIDVGQPVTIGAVKVNNSWDYNPNMYDIWADFIKTASGYAGPRIPYK